MRFEGGKIVTHKKKDYFTYWNILLQGVVLTLVILLYVPVTVFGKSLPSYEKIRSIFMYTIVPMTIISISFTFAIRFSVIDHMVDETDNLNIKQSENVKMVNVYSMMRKDYQIHLLPAAIALVLIFTLFMTTNLSNTERLTVFTTASLYAGVIIIAWFMIPATRMEGDPEGALILGNKIKALYGNYSPLNVIFFVSAFSLALIAQLLLFRHCS